MEEPSEAVFAAKVEPSAVNEPERLNTAPPIPCPPFAPVPPTAAFPASVESRIVSSPCMLKIAPPIPAPPPPPRPAPAAARAVLAGAQPRATAAVHHRANDVGGASGSAAGEGAGAEAAAARGPCVGSDPPAA